jgi:predicted permease
MGYISSVIYFFNSIAVMAMLLLLMAMGRRLGQALELPRYHRFYLVGVISFLLPLPLVLILLAFRAWGLPDPDVARSAIIKSTAVMLPLSVGITFAIYATAKYWSWIWGELRQSRKGGSEKDGS